MFENLFEAVEFLTTRFRLLATKALTDEFFVAPGGSSRHHNYRGGLAQHTLEVVNCCRSMAGADINTDVLCTAAIWHDFFKTKEYILREDGAVGKTEFLYRIGHVVSSAELLKKLAEESGEFSPEEIEAMYHCCLSHHGRKEWGSPVEPRSKEAWILHSSDMLSSRGLL